MTGHARLPASQTKQWAECPGSTAYLEAHPDLEEASGYHAQLGTAAHALSERCLSEGSEPSDYTGRLIEIVDPDGEEGTSILKEGAKWPKGTSRVLFEVDVDMAEAVECMTGYVRMRCVELGLIDPLATPEETAMNVVGLIKRGTVRLETKVVPLPERDDTGGTGDVIIDAWPELIEVVDYKNGSGVFVPVEGNEQLRSYGLGALQEAGSGDYVWVRYTICQPRHLQSPPDGIMSEEVPASELMEWKKWLAGRADRVDDARAAVAAGATLEDLFAGELLSVGEDAEHCRFCDLQTICPAALAKAQELAVVDFDDEPADVETPTGGNHLAVLMPWIPFLDRWCKAIMASGESLLLSGGKVEGQKVVRRKSTGRKWITHRQAEGEEDGVLAEVTEDDIVDELVEDFGIVRASLFTEPKLLTAPQTEKLLPKARRKELENRLMFKPEGSLTIAPEDDNRDAVEVDPAADFPDGED